MKLKIRNIYGEKLDVLIEGNRNSKDAIVFVHGYGTDKDENFASFLDLANYLSDNYFLIRFDLSGYGQSGGKDYEFQFHKAAGDVDSVIRYLRKNYPNKRINIIAHSLGTFVVSLLSPYKIRKTVFTAIVNSNTKFVSKWLEDRILSKGGKVEKEGTTIYPRTHGATQKIGKDFWRTLENINPVEYIQELADKTDLIIFKPRQDEILPDKFFNEYREIKNIKYMEVNGDHNFRNPKDRENLFRLIKDFLA